jgi:hypothetical protein
MLDKYDFSYMAAKILTGETSSIITVKFDDNIRYMPKSFSIGDIRLFENTNTDNLSIPCSLSDFENVLEVLDLDEIDLDELDPKNYAMVLDISCILKLNSKIKTYYAILNSIVFRQITGIAPQEYLNESKITIPYYNTLIQVYKSIKSIIDDIKHFKPDHTFKQIDKIIHLIDDHINDEGFNIDKYVNTLQTLMLSICV